MGWTSGGGLAADVWDAVRDAIPPSKRRKCARRIILAFEDEDCDTLDECEDLIADAGVEWFEGER